MIQGGRRFLLMAVIGILVVLGGVGDSLGVGGSAHIGLSAAFRAPTALAPASAISSSWYCSVATVPVSPVGPPSTLPAGAPPPTATSTKSVPSTSRAPKASKVAPSKPASSPTPVTTAGAVIALANTGSVGVSGTVTVVGQSSVVEVPVSVPAHGKATLAESPLVKGSDIAATVFLNGGGVAVEQLFTYGSALTVAPCASTSSSSWYFASGSTAGSNQMLVSLYNPLPTNAVVDVSFATPQGSTAPSDDQGIVVPASSQVVVNVGAHVQQQALVATTVDVLEGRVVAEEAQLSPTSEASGVTFCLGATESGPTWDLAAGLVAPGTSDRLDIYNPTSVGASVKLALALSFGSTDPIPVSVPPASVVEVVANNQPRIPHNSLFGVNVASTKGVVVVERSFVDQAPQNQQGLTEAIGGLPGNSWVLASGAPSRGSRELVVIENPGSVPVSVTATDMSGGTAEPVPAVSGKAVPAGRPLTLSLSSAAQADPLTINSTGPVIVEQEIVGPGGHGVSSLLGEPAG